MATTNIDLVEMGDASIAGGDGDVLELDVHVVFRLEQLAPVHLAGSQFQGHNVALETGGLDVLRGKY